VTEKFQKKEIEKPVSWGMLIKSALDLTSSRLTDIQTGNLPQILPSTEEEITDLNLDQFLFTFSPLDRIWLSSIFPEAQDIISTFFAIPLEAEENNLFIATASIEQLPQITLELPSLKQDLGLLVEYAQEYLYPIHIQASATIQTSRRTDPLLPTNSDEAIPQVNVGLIDMQPSSQNQILDIKASLESKVDSLEEIVGESALILSKDLANKLQIYDKLWKTLFRFNINRAWFVTEEQHTSNYTWAKGRPFYEVHLILEIKQMLSSDESTPLQVQLVNPKKSNIYRHTLDLNALAKGRPIPSSDNLDKKTNFNLRRHCPPHPSLLPHYQEAKLKPHTFT
jgi:hypothetical protein